VTLHRQDGLLVFQHLFYLVHFALGEVFGDVGFAAFWAAGDLVAVASAEIFEDGFFFFEGEFAFVAD
jgi:hypothetical protein